MSSTPAKVTEISLAGAVQNGISVDGLAVARIEFTLPDGRKIAADLPHQSTEGPTLTPMQAAVAQAVEEMKPGDVLGFEEIAEKAGYSNGEGLRQFVRTLSEVGKLDKAPRGWKRR